MKHGNWRKSSASGTSNCVEVAISDNSVMVRNTRDRDRSLSFTEAEWVKFLTDAEDGKYNLAALPSISGPSDRTAHATDEP